MAYGPLLAFVVFSTRLLLPAGLEDTFIISRPGLLARRPRFSSSRLLLLLLWSARLAVGGFLVFLLLLRPVTCCSMLRVPVCRDLRRSDPAPFHTNRDHPDGDQPCSGCPTNAPGHACRWGAVSDGTTEALSLLTVKSPSNVPGRLASSLRPVVRGWRAMLALSGRCCWPAGVGFIQFPFCASPVGRNRSSVSSRHHEEVGVGLCRPIKYYLNHLNMRL